jgi:hypothetical protein
MGINQYHRSVPMSEVTRILSAIRHGDPYPAEQLLPLVYDELRSLAAQLCGCWELSCLEYLQVPHGAVGCAAAESAFD